MGSRSSSGSGEMYPDSMTSHTGEGDRGQQPDQSRSPLICSGTEPVSPAGERSSVKYWGWEIIGISFHITCTTVLVPKISVACTCCFSNVPGFKTFQMALKPLLLWNFRGTFLQSLFLYVCLKVFFIFLFKYLFTYFTLDLNLIHLYFIYL